MLCFCFSFCFRLLFGWHTRQRYKQILALVKPFRWPHARAKYIITAAYVLRWIVSTLASSANPMILKWILWTYSWLHSYSRKHTEHIEIVISRRMRSCDRVSSRYKRIFICKNLVHINLGGNRLFESITVWCTVAAASRYCDCITCLMFGASLLHYLDLNSSLA